MWLVSGVLALSVGLSTSLVAQVAPSITTDGRYVLALVRKTNIDSEAPTLVVQATRDPWRLEIPGGRNPQFLPDNQALLWQRGDTVWQLALGAEKPSVVAGVRSYEPLFRARGGPWLVYHSNESDRSLVLRHLPTGQERRFTDVSAYVVSPEESVLLLQTTTRAAGAASRADTAERTTLVWVELPSGAERTIWNGQGQVIGGTHAFTFDTAGQQVVFVVRTPRDSGGQETIWHYESGAPQATVLVEDGTPGVDAGFTVTGWSSTQPARFSPNGRRVFFRLREPARPQPRPGAVDIWSYTDAKVQSQQLVRLTQRRAYAAMVLLPGRRVVRLEQELDVLLGSSGLSDALSDEHALLCAFDDDVIRLFGYYDGGELLIVDTYTMNDYNWSKAARCSVTLVRLRDGRRTVLRSQMRNTSSTFPYFRLSPGGRYVVFYDPWRKEYGSHEIASGVTRPLTRDVTARWTQEDLEGPPRDFNRPVGLYGWLGDAAVMVLDHYSDLWQLDLTAHRPPVNLTNGYARRHQVRFQWRWAAPTTILHTETVRLVEGGPWSPGRIAYSGWYRVRLDRAAEPRQLVRPGGQYSYTSLASGVGAGDTVYVASRESMTDPPSAWYTRDFRAWTPVTDALPDQRRASRRELLTWKAFNGHEVQGILWLPRYFDPRRKYPVITIIYEKAASNAFERGRFIPERDMPWTDAGYLVFNPNIHYTIGATGESVYDAVVAGAEYVATLPFVDGRRIGLWGFSFGGFESRYLLTRTSIFAAAYSGAGVSDFLSYYGTEEKDLAGYSYMASTETGQHRLGGTPWDLREVFLRHSAVLHADKITTPLLLSHNYDDYRVPFSQSMELYTALRRLGRPVWLIAGYGGHASAMGDVAVRVRQFFDHYLKGAVAPRWMTRGIPVARRGLETGLELDSAMAAPGPGLLDTLVRTPQQGRALEQHGRPDRRP